MGLRPEPKNEVELCKRVIDMLAVCLSADLKITEHPDRDERNEEAVEIVCTSLRASRLRLSTRIESFDGQIGDGYAFSGLLEPLEDELKGRFSIAYCEERNGNIVGPTRARRLISACRRRRSARP